MAKETKITMDLSKLEGIRRKLGSNYIARVGILGADAAATHMEPKTVYDTQTGKPRRVAGTAAGGLTNAALGVIHELGSVTRGIPARSFLRLPIETKGKEIVQLLNSKAVKEMIGAGNMKGVFNLLAIKAEQIVQRAFETRGFGQWAPLKQATIEAKGSSAPLIDSAQLRQAVTSDVVER